MSVVTEDMTRWKHLDLSQTTDWTEGRDLIDAFFDPLASPSTQPPAAPGIAAASYQRICSEQDEVPDLELIETVASSSSSVSTSVDGKLPGVIQVQSSDTSYNSSLGENRNPGTFALTSVRRLLFGHSPTKLPVILANGAKSTTELDAKKHETARTENLKVLSLQSGEADHEVQLKTGPTSIMKSTISGASSNMSPPKAKVGSGQCQSVVGEGHAMSTHEEAAEHAPDSFEGDDNDAEQYPKSAKEKARYMDRDEDVINTATTLCSMMREEEKSIHSSRSLSPILPSDSAAESRRGGSESPLKHEIRSFAQDDEIRESLTARETDKRSRESSSVFDASFRVLPHTHTKGATSDKLCELDGFNRTLSKARTNKRRGDSIVDVLKDSFQASSRSTHLPLQAHKKQALQYVDPEQLGTDRQLFAMLDHNSQRFELTPTKLRAARQIDELNARRVAAGMPCLTKEPLSRHNDQDAAIDTTSRKRRHSPKSEADALVNPWNDGKVDVNTPRLTRAREADQGSETAEGLAAVRKRRHYTTGAEALLDAWNSGEVDPDTPRLTRAQEAQQDAKCKARTPKAALAITTRRRRVQKSEKKD